MEPEGLESINWGTKKRIREHTFLVVEIDVTYRTDGKKFAEVILAKV